MLQTLLEPHYVDQQEPAHSVVAADGDQVVQGRDKRTGRNCGVNLDPLKEQRDQCADDGREDHGDEKRSSDAAAYRKSKCGFLLLDDHQINADKDN